MSKKRKLKDRKMPRLQHYKEGEETLSAHKEAAYKVLRVNLVGGKISGHQFVHGAMVSGLKSYEGYYKEGLITRPLRKGMSLVSTLLLKSGISILHDLGEDMRKSERF